MASEIDLPRFAREIGDSAKDVNTDVLREQLLEDMGRAQDVLSGVEDASMGLVFGLKKPVRQLVQTYQALLNDCGTLSIEIRGHTSTLQTHVNRWITAMETVSMAASFDTWFESVGAAYRDQFQLAKSIFMRATLRTPRVAAYKSGDELQAILEQEYEGRTLDEGFVLLLCGKIADIQRSLHKDFAVSVLSLMKAICNRSHGLREGLESLLDRYRQFLVDIEVVLKKTKKAFWKSLLIGLVMGILIGIVSCAGLAGIIGGGCVLWAPLTAAMASTATAAGVAAAPVMATTGLPIAEMFGAGAIGGGVACFATATALLPSLYKVCNQTYDITKVSNALETLHGSATKEAEMWDHLTQQFGLFSDYLESQTQSEMCWTVFEMSGDRMITFKDDMNKLVSIMAGVDKAFAAYWDSVKQTQLYLTTTVLRKLK